jgi:hypothetical protein
MALTTPDDVKSSCVIAFPIIYPYRVVGERYKIGTWQNCWQRVRIQKELSDEMSSELDPTWLGQVTKAEDKVRKH